MHIILMCMSAAEKILDGLRETREIVRLITLPHDLACPVSRDAAEGPCNCGVLSAEERARLYWRMRRSGAQLEMCV